MGTAERELRDVRPRRRRDDHDGLGFLVRPGTTDAAARRSPGAARPNAVDSNVHHGHGPASSRTPRRGRETMSKYLIVGLFLLAAVLAFGISAKASVGG